MNASAKNSKWSGKRIWTCDKERKFTAKAKFVMDDNFFRPVTRLPKEKQKGGTFSPSCRSDSIGRLHRVFYRNASTAQSCSPCLSKLLGRSLRRKTLSRRDIPVSDPIEVAMNVTRFFYIDAMLRQITESVRINHVHHHKVRVELFTNPENYYHAHGNWTL